MGVIIIASENLDRKKHIVNGVCQRVVLGHSFVRIDSRSAAKFLEIRAPFY